MLYILDRRLGHQPDLCKMRAWQTCRAGESSGILAKLEKEARPESAHRRSNDRASILSAARDPVVSANGHECSRFRESIIPAYETIQYHSSVVGYVRVDRLILKGLVKSTQCSMSPEIKAVQLSRSYFRFR